MTKAHYKAHHKELYETMKLQAMASQKQEKKLQVILGGYMMRRTGLEKTFTETLEKIESLRIDYSVFSNLAAKERELIQARLAD
jgi:pre-mRNA-splicing factor CDC5/CEF1